MTNKTYWALKKREWAARGRTRQRRRNVPLRVGTPREAPIPAATLEATAAEVVEVTAEEPSYRDLQAEAKDLGIKANQPAEDLKKAIENA